MTVAVSLVMIARDEESVIGRALDSVRSVVDEMVVVDTGSQDRTVWVAEERGAQVAFFEWRDDFAAAKNHALGLAAGRSRLVMDADEWLVSDPAAARRWVIGHTQTLGVVTLVNAFDSAGIVQHDTALITRVLPRGTAYEGAVHEQPVGDGATAMSPLVLHHDGYLGRNLDRKRGRNSRLLRRALDQAPRDGYLWYQLGVALATDGSDHQACAAFESALPLVDEAAPERHPLVVRYLHALGRAGRFEDAQRLYRAEVTVWAESPDLHFVMADVLLDYGVRRPNRATSVVPAIRALLERCLSIGERPDLTGAVAGRGSFTARHNLDLLIQPATRPAGSDEEGQRAHHVEAQTS